MDWAIFLTSSFAVGKFREEAIPHTVISAAHLRSRRQSETFCETNAYVLSECDSIFDQY